MRTAQETWEKRHRTKESRTDYNKRNYAKRIKQLNHMKEDEEFLNWLLHCSDDVFDMIEKFGYGELFTNADLANKMGRVLDRLSGSFYVSDSVRKHAKCYVMLMIKFNNEIRPFKIEDDMELPDLPF